MRKFFQDWTPGQLLVIGLLAALLLWGMLLVLNPDGVSSRVFYDQGRDLFGDFRMPRVCAEWGYANDLQPLHDSCYPALGSLLVRPFSFEEGGWFMGLGVVLWVGAFLVLTGSGGRSLGTLGAALGSSVFLYAIERGNPIVYAAAGCMVYVAWYDARSPWKRLVAMMFLAIATALKIVPVVLIVLELARWRRLETCMEERRTILVDLVFGAVVGSVFFFLPFAWCGGIEGFRQWFSNAAGNAAYYSHTGAWGFVAIGRTVRAAALHMDVTHPWRGMGIERLANILLGMMCLGMAFRSLWQGLLSRGNGLLLVTASMLLLSGNMHFYAGLYLLPVLAVRLKEGMEWFEACCWFAMLCPLQIPFGAGCLNHPLANLAFLGLVGMAMWSVWRGESRRLMAAEG